MNAAERIIERLTMKEVIEKYYTTDIKKGMCLCPFHKEKTPSMKIFDGKKGFYCFGCGTGGNVINFVEKYFDLNYKEAVVRLDYDFSLGIFVKPTLKQRRKMSNEMKAKKAAKEEDEKLRCISRYNYFALCTFLNWLRSNNGLNSDINFLDALLERSMKSKALCEYNADACINALLSKYGEEVRAEWNKFRSTRRMIS